MKEEDKEYLELLNRAYLESSSQFDKQLLFVSSSALGISLAFIKDIVKLNIATYKTLLVFSWISFSLVILISILSHYTSLKAMNLKIENINYKDYKSNFNFLTRLFNIVMIVLLALGLILLNTFIGLNI